MTGPPAAPSGDQGGAGAEAPGPKDTSGRYHRRGLEVGRELSDYFSTVSLLIFPGKKQPQRRCVTCSERQYGGWNLDIPLKKTMLPLIFTKGLCPSSSVRSVQSLSRVRLFATPWTAASQASLFIANTRSVLKLMSIESVMPSNHLISIRWPKYWSFSFSISPSNEYSGLISLRMDWLDLLAVQGTLKSRLQHHSSKESILRPSGGFCN